MRVAIFPARGGSVRIPRKNIREFRGRPMIQWPIEAARASGLFDHIIVSTDDVEIRGVAQALGCEVHMRSQDDGATGTQEIAARVLQWLHAAPSDECCVIYPCSPMLQPDDLLSTHGYWCGAAEAFLFVEGCLYWGRARDFMERLPLEGHAVQWTGVGRLIDINVELDWRAAEDLFDAYQRS